MTEKKSPLRRPPLRQAGQSLQEEIDRISDGKISDYAVILCFPIAFALMEWIFVYFKTPRQPWLMTGLALICFAYAWVKLQPLYKTRRNLRLARDGERIVGQELEKLRANGFRIYHDFLGDGFNIDHIVVGPTGVFTINTKTISQPKNNNIPIQYDGVELRVPGTTFDQDPIAQAKGEGNFVHTWIKEKANREVPVRAAVVFVGWNIVDQPKGADVWVLNVPGLLSFIKNEWSELSQDDIVHICGILENHILLKEEFLSGKSAKTWSV